MREIKNQMVTVLETLQSSAGGSDEESNDMPVQLPVQTHEQLLRLEEELNDQALQKNMASFCYVVSVWL